MLLLLLFICGWRYCIFGAGGERERESERLSRIPKGEIIKTGQQPTTTPTHKPRIIREASLVTGAVRARNKKKFCQKYLKTLRCVFWEPI